MTHLKISIKKLHLRITNMSGIAFLVTSKVKMLTIYLWKIQVHIVDQLINNK